MFITKDFDMNKGKCTTVAPDQQYVATVFWSERHMLMRVTDILSG